MAKIDIKKNQETSDELSYIYPEGEKITIDKANLQIQLDKFKLAIINEFNLQSVLNMIIILAAVWVPVLTSDFKTIFNLSSITVRSLYLGFSSFVTIYIINKYVIQPTRIYFQPLNTASSNSEKMAQIILDKCNKK